MNYKIAVDQFILIHHFLMSNIDLKLQNKKSLEANKLLCFKLRNYIPKRIYKNYLFRSTQ